jgi:hypothetical protein
MPVDYGGYEQQRRDVDYRHGTDAMANAYGRFISQQRGSRNLSDTSRTFGRGYEGQKAQFGQRGLSGGGIKSGVMQRSMRNYLGDYGRDYGRQQQDLTENLRQYDLGQDQSDAYRQQALGDIDTRQATEMANAAQNLEFLRGQVGGL